MYIYNQDEIVVLQKAESFFFWSNQKAESYSLKNGGKIATGTNTNQTDNFGFQQKRNES